MDGEVAQLAALAISANHRIAAPDDPMGWFADHRAFSSCGSVEFHAARKPRFGKARRVPVAATPSEWLDRLQASGIERVVLGFERQDSNPEEDETLPDRIMAGFAGGGSLWSMTTESADGGALLWRPGWRAAFREAKDGRIWAVEYTAEPSAPAPLGNGVCQASETLGRAVDGIRDFAGRHHFANVSAIFSSALSLLAGAPDPRPVPRPPGPPDVLDEPARRLLYAAQRAWVFDNLGLWRDQDFSHDIWEEYADLSEALYEAVTAAMVAAVNSSVPGNGAVTS